jgi:phosphoglycolate phosphatase
MHLLVDLDGTRRNKGDLIAHILRRDRLAPDDVIMVGDRAPDVHGARQNGVHALGVLWGYGLREELEAAGAAACIASPGELPEVVRSCSHRNAVGESANA